MKEAPAGPCILYAISCGLSERELVDQHALLSKGKGGTSTEPDETGGQPDSEQEGSSGGGGKFKLTPWKRRTHRGLGEEPVRCRAIPLIDHFHRMMQLWVAADVVKVNAHLDRHGLRHSQIFAQLIQALIEQSRAEGSQDECSILERLANHLKQVGGAARGAFAIGD